MIKPMSPPQINPVMTGIGIAFAGVERPTPPTKTTASRPSRRTVMNGRTNMESEQYQLCPFTSCITHIFVTTLVSFPIGS